MYSLRRVILENKWKVQLEELLAYCREVPIVEVLFKEQSHQILMVPYSLEKHRRMAEIYRQMAITMQSAGVRYGVNIASIVGHADADVPKEYVLPFQKFVNAGLQPASSTVS